MVSDGPGRQGSRWRRARLACIAEGERNQSACYLCGKPIDYPLAQQRPRSAMAATAHRITALELGGNPLDPANLAPAHKGCNTADANKQRATITYQQARVHRHHDQQRFTA